MVQRHPRHAFFVPAVALDVVVLLLDDRMSARISLLFHGDTPREFPPGILPAENFEA
jgi:hypothetical protein